MEWLGLSVIGAMVGVAVTVVVCVVAYRRTRAEPRRLSNAYWLLGAVLLAVQTAAAVGVPGGGLAVVALSVLTLASPVLIIALAGFCVLNGLVMLRRESLTLGNVLSLGFGLGLLALAVALVPVLLSGSPLLIVAYLAVIAAVSYLGFQFAAFVGYSLLYPRLVRHHEADWVVVLGSGLRADGTLPPLLASRVRTGMTAAARHDAAVLIMSGGKGDDEIRSEASAMAEHATALGVDPAHLAVEDRSRTTEQNLRFTADLIAGSHLVRPAISSIAGGGAVPAPTQRPSGLVLPTPPGLIVTSNYHVLRAAMLARRVGLPAQAVGAPTAGYYWPSAMIREFVAVLATHRIAHAVLTLVCAAPVLLVGLLVLMAG